MAERSRYSEDKEHFLIGGISVRFLVPPNELVEEALTQAADCMAEAKALRRREQAALPIEQK